MANKNLARPNQGNRATFVGGIMGLALFLAVGLLPSLLYGGYAGLILGSAIFGTPIHENVFAQATVVLGVVSGVLAIGGTFVLGGAILAAGVYGFVTALRAAHAERKETEAEEEAEAEVTRM